MSESTYIVELIGDSAKIDAFVEALGGRSILEVVRSGSMGIVRGEKALRA